MTDATDGKRIADDQRQSLANYATWRNTVEIKSISRITFYVMIVWHFLGHFSHLIFGGYWISPPYCWLFGTTSFNDWISYNLFWSGFVAATGIAGFIAMKPRSLTTVDRSPPSQPHRSP
jgi:hypothetical protein